MPQLPEARQLQDSQIQQKSTDIAQIFNRPPDELSELYGRALHLSSTTYINDSSSVSIKPHEESILADIRLLSVRVI